MTPGKTAPRPATPREIARLRARLTEAVATLRAIRRGEVDTLVVTGKQGPQVFTLQGAEEAYRTLIESMNEGALTLTTDKMILYANQCFARLVNCPLEQIIGRSFRRFLSAADRVTLRAMLKRAAKSGSKIQMLLKSENGAAVPVQISVRLLANDGLNREIIGMVVTDMTEVRRNEERLRALTNRVVQAQEGERGRVALELHDHITQLLCAIVFRSQTLVGKLTHEAAAKKEAIAMRTMLAGAVEEVERISRALRPSVLDHLGLGAVLRETAADFTNRTGVPVKLVSAQLTERLPADTELTLYRILQEALKNIEKHARARGVNVSLSQHGDFVQLEINDDGVGFNPGRRRGASKSKSKGKAGLGLLGMHERASHVSGVLTVKSARRAGTQVTVRIPIAPAPAAAA